MGKIKDNLQSREVQLFDMYGDPPQFTLHEMRLVFRTRIFLNYAAAVVLLLTAFDTHGYRAGGMHLAANVFLWAVCVACYVTVYAAVLAAWVALAPGGRVVRLFRLVPMTAAMSLTTVVVLAMAAQYSMLAFGMPALMRHIPYNLLLSFTFESLLVLFILPHIDTSLGLGLYRKAERAAEPAAAPSAAPAAVTEEWIEDPVQDPSPAAEPASARPVVLGGKSFALEDLRYVKSEEHYLRVATQTGQQTLRGRLGDLIAQVPAGAGIQPHRSWWVARAAVAGLKRGSQSDVLLLEEGIRVPVARGRRAQVRETARDWQITEH
ncbi:LytTR family DNA-binding domain-containing protein [Leisingera sp. ANG-M1]|uniref:LytTR family DNA-binding domain-containing protein n=1 Tax=Leisingera sp. ANG-M1 TaxID=1577895 RepID=UPI0006914F47|nr:LytTR family DNA-binding domain-containing protein [Leisingera sp. ANG-M1]